MFTVESGDTSDKTTHELMPLKANNFFVNNINNIYDFLWVFID